MSVYHYQTLMYWNHQRTFIVSEITFLFKKFQEKKNTEKEYYNITLVTDRASGSSKVSRFSQSVDIMLSYLLGYFRKISYTCTMHTDPTCRQFTPPTSTTEIYILLLMTFTCDSIYAIARICHANSVCLSVCLSHTWFESKRLNASSKSFMIW